MVEGMSSGAISAIAASISALAAVTALWVTNNISRKHHVESLKLSQYIAITQRVFDVDMLFVKNPDLRSYFYESKLVTTSCNIQQITAIAEYILDFYSTIQEHERLLSSQSTPSWEEWKSFIADGFHGAPFLCHYFDQNATWYEEGLMKIYRPIARERQDIIVRQRAALSNGDQ